MTGFDKFTAVLAALLGVVFVIFGVMGIFLPIRLWASLPPVFSSIWFFVGWGILRSVYIAWSVEPTPKKSHQSILPAEPESSLFKNPEPYPEFLSSVDRSSEQNDPPASE